MDDAELRALIDTVISRLTGNPEHATRESFIRRDVNRAMRTLEDGSERDKREAAAALRVWV